MRRFQDKCHQYSQNRKHAFIIISDNDSAPCIGAVSKDEYRKSIDDIIYFLEGHTKQIEDELKQKMLDARGKDGI